MYDNLAKVGVLRNQKPVIIATSSTAAMTASILVTTAITIPLLARTSAFILRPYYRRPYPALEQHLLLGVSQHRREELDQH